MTKKEEIEDAAKNKKRSKKKSLKDQSLKDIAVSKKSSLKKVDKLKESFKTSD